MARLAARWRRRASTRRTGWLRGAMASVEPPAQTATRRPCCGLPKAGRGTAGAGAQRRTQGQLACCDGVAALSRNFGDLADASCHADYLRAIEGEQLRFEFLPSRIVVDVHPEYLSRKPRAGDGASAGRLLPKSSTITRTRCAWPKRPGAGLFAADRRRPRRPGLRRRRHAVGRRVLMLADYRQCRRLASFKPVALLGGAQAMTAESRGEIPTRS